MSQKINTAKRFIALLVVFGFLMPSPAYSSRPQGTARSPIILDSLSQALLATEPARSEVRGGVDFSKVRFGFNDPQVKTTHSFASFNIGGLLNRPLNVLPDQAIEAVRAYLNKAYDKKWFKGVKVVDLTASHIQVHVTHNYGDNNADVHRILIEAVRAGLETMKKQLKTDPSTMSAIDLAKETQVTFSDHPFKERAGVSESVEVAMGVNVDISAFNNTAWELFGALDFNPASTLSGDRIRGYRFYFQKREDILHGKKGIKVLEFSIGENGEPDVNQLREIKILLSQNENVVTAVYPVPGRAFKDPTEPLMTVTFQPAFGSDGRPVLNPIAIFRGQSGGPPVGAVGHAVANTRYVLGGRDADRYVAVRPFTLEEARKPLKEEGIGGFVMYGYEQAGNGYMPRNQYIPDYYGLSKTFLHSYIRKARRFAKIMLAHAGFQPYLHPRAAAKRALPVRHALNDRFVNVVKDFDPDPFYQDVERRVQSGELVKITSGKADYGALNGHTKAPALYTALERAYLQVMKEKGLIVDYFTLAQDPNDKMKRVRLEDNYAVGDDTHMTVIGGKIEDVQIIIKRAMAVGPAFHMLAYKDTDQPEKPGIGTYGLFQDLQGSDADAVKKDPFGWLGLSDESVTERFFELANQLVDERDIKAGVIRSLYDQWKAWKQTPAGHEVQEIVRGSGNTSAQGIGVAYQYMDPKKDGGYAELDADKMGPQSKNVLFFPAMQNALPDHPNGLVAEIWDLKAFDEDDNIASEDLPKSWSDISYLVLSARKAKEPRITAEDAEWLKIKAYPSGVLATSIDYERLGHILKHIGFVPSKRIFVDVATELDKIELLLGDSDRFNVKAIWDKKEVGWDSNHVEDYLDRPIVMSTVSRLGLLAGGEYVGKDDDKVMGVMSFMQRMFDYLEKNPWMLQGDMNGSHQLWALLLSVREAVATLNSAPIAAALINHFDENGKLTHVTDVFDSPAFRKQSKKAAEFNLDFILAQRATNPHLAHREQVEGAYAIEAISAALDAPESPFWLDKLRSQKPDEYPEPVSADAFTLYAAATTDRAVAYQELSRSEARTPRVSKFRFKLEKGENQILGTTPDGFRWEAVPFLLDDKVTLNSFRRFLKRAGTLTYDEGRINHLVELFNANDWAQRSDRPELILATPPGKKTEDMKALFVGISVYHQGRFEVINFDRRIEPNFFGEYLNLWLMKNPGRVAAYDTPDDHHYVEPKKASLYSPDGKEIILDLELKSRSEARIAAAPKMDLSGLALPQVSEAARLTALKTFTSSLNEAYYLDDAFVLKGGLAFVGTIFNGPIVVRTNNPEVIAQVRAFQEKFHPSFVSVAETPELAKQELDSLISKAEGSFTRRAIVTNDSSFDVRAAFIKELGQRQVSIITQEQFGQMTRAAGLVEVVAQLVASFKEIATAA